MSCCINKQGGKAVTYEHILLEKDDHVAIVTLNRPERLNALNPTLWEEIIGIGEES